MPAPSIAADLATRIRTACLPYPVTAGYLFGSYARGSADVESDLDVAILAAPNVGRSDRHELRLAVLRDLAHALDLPFEKIDVIVLQDVPVLLQYNVIRSGIPTFERSAAERIDYELAVERAYEDERTFLDLEASLTVERVLAYAA